MDCLLCHETFYHFYDYCDHMDGLCELDWILSVTIPPPFFKTPTECCLKFEPVLWLDNSDDEFEVGESSSSGTSVIPSMKLNATIKTKPIDPKAGNKNFKKPVETRHSVLKQPARHDAFKESMLERFTALKQSTIFKTRSETSVDCNVQQHKIKLIDEEYVVDDRINVVDRARVSARTNEMVHVGPILCTLRNLASYNSDLCQAGCLLDERHGSKGNAVLGAYICRVANEDQALLFFPGSRLPLDPKINDVLSVRFGVPNLDMETKYQTFQSEAIVQRWAGNSDSRPTQFTRKGEWEDRLVSQQFIKDDCLVVDQPKNEFKFMNAEVSLGRCFSLRQTSDLNFDVVEAPRRSVLISATRNPINIKTNLKHPEDVVLQNTDSINFPLGLVDEQEESNNVISVINVSIPLTATDGTVLSYTTLSDLLNAEGKAAKRLKLCSSTNCCIEATIKGNQGKLVGGAIGMAYCEGSKTGKHLTSNLYSQHHKIMNPFQQEMETFIFRPANAFPSWSPMQIMNISAGFGIVFIGPFTNPPRAGVNITVEFRIVSANSIPNDPIGNLATVRYLHGKRLARVALEQGKTGIVRRIPIFLGNPYIDDGRYFFNQLSSVCSQFQSVTGKITIECFVYSSLLIGGVVNVALIPTARINALTLDVLNQMPHGKVGLQPGSNLLEFDVGKDGAWCATMSNTLAYTNSIVSTLVLAIWSNGGIASTIDGDFLVDASIKSFELEQRYGHGPQLKYSLVAQNEEQWNFPNTWYNLFFARGKKTPFSTEAISEELDLFALANARLENVGKDNVWFRTFPAGLCVGYTSAFARYKFKLKVCWFKKPNVTIANCLHVVSTSLYPFGSTYAPTDHIVSSEPSGSYEFNVEVAGPFRGFRFTGNADSLPGQAAKGLLRVTFDNPSTLDSYAICVKFEHIEFANPSNGFTWVDASVKRCDVVT